MTASQRRAQKRLAEMQREVHAETRRSTIYATVYPKAAPPHHRKKDYRLTFGVKSACQNEVENFMLELGYGCSDYWLSHTPPDGSYPVDVRIKKYYRKNRKFKGIRYSFGMGTWIKK